MLSRCFSGRDDEAGHPLGRSSLKLVNSAERQSLPPDVSRADDATEHPKHIPVRAP